MTNKLSNLNWLTAEKVAWYNSSIKNFGYPTNTNIVDNRIFEHKFPLKKYRLNKLALWLFDKFKTKHDDKYSCFRYLEEIAEFKDKKMEISYLGGYEFNPPLMIPINMFEYQCTKCGKKYTI